MTAPELSTRYMLALCVWREGRGESFRGKQLIAATVLNRMKDRRWPSTVTGVVTQPRQFSAFNAGDPNATLFPHEADPSWVDSVRASESVLESPVSLTTANHYCVKTLRPAWFLDSAVVEREGNHVFLAL